ncbi:MAG: hypothetical protein REI78_00425 [Pedobacter sp.]|nr:hypothetical protein [Pedobacter sp.]MDQ8051451.1 hypothetical protein [Pedobacter sp.]
MKKLMLICLLELSVLSGFAQTSAWRDDAGLRGDAGAVSGYFETNLPVNFPAGATSWWHLLDVRHSNSTNNFAMQFAGSFFDQHFWVRKTNDNAAQTWSRVITELNRQAHISNLYLDGNIGIGAPSTSRRLEIRTTSGSPHGLFIGPDGNNQCYFTLDRKSGQDGGMLWSKNNTFTWQQVTNDDDTMHWYSYAKGDVVLSMTKMGFLGLGTQYPAEKLSVNGKIRAQEIKVETTGWPDYVFDDDYQHASLAELEQFIKLNRHLPDMPTAKDVAENGVSLGDLSKQLLKKQEELTLHLIAQDKKINELLKLVAAQQEVINALKKP